MKFVLQRTRTLTSLMGHSIAFVKGVQTEVPDSMYHEAIGIGAVPETELVEDPAVHRIPTDGNVRQADIMKAFEQIMLRTDREDFTAAGTPHPRAVSKLVGYSVSAKERDDAWAVFQAVTEDA